MAAAALRRSQRGALSAPYLLLLLLLLGAARLLAAPPRRAFASQAATLLADSNATVGGRHFRRQLVDLVAAQRPTVVVVGAGRGKRYADDHMMGLVARRSTRGVLIEASGANYASLLRSTAACHTAAYHCVHALLAWGAGAGGGAGAGAGVKRMLYGVNATLLRAEWADAQPPEWLLHGSGSVDAAHVLRALSKAAGARAHLGWRPLHALEHYVTEECVPTVTARAVLAQLAVRPAVLHVDVEGYDWEVVMAFLEHVAPLVIVFERVHLSASTLVNARSMLRALGYAVFNLSWRNVCAVYVGAQA